MSTESNVQATKLVLSELDLSSEGSSQAIAFLLEHKDYEVRLETLRFLRRNISKKHQQ